MLSLLLCVNTILQPWRNIRERMRISERYLKSNHDLQIDGKNKEHFLRQDNTFFFRYHDREKRNVLYVLCGSLACVVFVGAAFAIPITVTSVLAKTMTTEDTTSAAVSSTGEIDTSDSESASIDFLVTPTNTSLTTATNASVAPLTNTSLTATAGTVSTTTICLNMTCSFSSVAAPMSSTYGVEHLSFNCSQSLMSMDIQIIVQRTVNASYASQYQTFWSLTTNQTYIQTGSQIIYTWTLLSGATIQGIGFPYFVEGQYNLYNINQTTNLDTFSAIFTSVCGHTILQNGTF